MAENCIAERLPTRVPLPGLAPGTTITSVRGDADQHPHRLYRRCCACREGRISSWPWPPSSGL